MFTGHYKDKFFCSKRGINKRGHFVLKSLAVMADGRPTCPIHHNFPLKATPSNSKCRIRMQSAKLSVD
jgi:hypothetical protein